MTPANPNHLRLMKTALGYSLISIVFGITTNCVFGLTIDQDFYPDTFSNRVYSADIHTVLLRSANWELSLPVIEAGSEQQLELRFDDLSAKQHTFGYTLVLCDANWKRSVLSPQEYLSGFGQGRIRASETSFNTTYDYIHYRLAFPEEDCRPILSGNYALVVYNEENPDKIMLTRRFYVTERTVRIEAKIKQPDYGNSKETGQQVEFTVLHDGSDIRDPLTEVRAVILQNNRDDNSLTILKPFSIQPGRLEYADPESGIFQGGNEFRSLDIKSMKYQTENIAAIDFQSPYFHVFMKPDESSGNKPYFSKTDLNGGYFINKEKSDDKHTEADYVFVHFNLSQPPIYAGSAIFVTGGFCDWINQGKNKMKYNSEKSCFELTLLLKQGLYDYCFMKDDPQSGKINEYELEGSHYETENDYVISIYFRDRNKGYDRLMGYLSIK
jgi:hypothetical protein